MKELAFAASPGEEAIDRVSIYAPRSLALALTRQACEDDGKRANEMLADMLRTLDGGCLSMVEALDAR